MPLASWYAHHSYPGLMSCVDVSAPAAEADLRGIGRMELTHVSAGFSDLMSLLATRQMQVESTANPIANLVLKGVGTMGLVGTIGELSQDDVTGAVWEVEMEPGVSFREAIQAIFAGGGGGGGGLSPAQDARLALIEKIQRNKFITDPATGVATLYDDDGTTVLLQGQLYEDTAGAQPYRGQGVSRRNRLT